MKLGKALHHVLRILSGSLFGVSLVLLHGTAGAQTDVSYPEKELESPKIYSPYVNRTAVDSNLAEGVYWGDTHLNTLHELHLTLLLVEAMEVESTPSLSENTEPTTRTRPK